MILMTKMDKRIVVLVLLLFASFALYYAFSPSQLSDAGFGELLGRSSQFAGLNPGLLKSLVFVAIFLSSAFIFLAATGIKKENEEEKHDVLPGLFAALLFLFSYFVITALVYVPSPAESLALPFAVLGAVLLTVPKFAKFKAVGIVPLAIGVYLTLPYLVPGVNLNVFASAPLIFAFSALALGYFLSMEKKKAEWPLVSFVLGICLAPLSLVLSLAFAGSAMAVSLARFFHEGGRVPLLTLVFALAFFTTCGNGNLVGSIAIAASITVLAYFLFSLYNFESKNLPLYFCLFALALALTLFLLVQFSHPFAAADDDYFAALKFAKDSGLSLALIDLPSTYNYVVGKPALKLNGTQLIQKRSPGQYYLFWSKSLPSSFDRYPVAFYYYGTSQDSQGNTVSLMVGGPYVLAIPVDVDGKIIKDGELYDAASLQLVKRIPFTKLKLFFGKSAIDPNAIIVSLDGIEDTPLYGAVLNGETVYENTEVKIIKTY